MSLLLFSLTWDLPLFVDIIKGLTLPRWMSRHVCSRGQLSSRPTFLPPPPPPSPHFKLRAPLIFSRSAARHASPSSSTTCNPSLFCAKPTRLFCLPLSPLSFELAGFVCPTFHMRLICSSCPRRWHVAGKGRRPRGTVHRRSVIRRIWIAPAADVSSRVSCAMEVPCL